MDHGAPSDDIRRDQALGLLAAGQPIGVVAAALKVNRSTVRRWRDQEPRGAPRTPVAQLEAAAAISVAARVEVLSTLAECHRMAAASLAKAMGVLVAQLDHEDPREARAAALAILDRGGMVAGSAVRVEVAHSPTPEELAVELLALPGPVADNREAVSK